MNTGRHPPLAKQARRGVRAIAIGLMAISTAMARVEAQTAGLAERSGIDSSIAVSSDCAGAEAVCYRSFEMPGGSGALHYVESAGRGPLAGTASASHAPTRALVVLHGHPRDARKTLDATLRALQGARARTDLGDGAVVVAPLFQVAPDAAGRCDSPGNPAARPGDLLWTCASWMEGGRAANGTRPTSFAALDALIDELVRRWPGLRSVTVAGFSAGAQMVQHHIGFAADRPAGAPRIRYVVASPGTWLYFDPVRPQPVAPGACPGFDDWKYGTGALPAALGRDAATARARYAAADITYLVGERDDGDVPGAFHRILDKSCAAEAQGTSSRLRRALAYARYDREVLAPDRRRTVTVIPGCAHDVACVFPAAAAWLRADEAPRKNAPHP